MTSSQIEIENLKHCVQNLNQENKTVNLEKKEMNKEKLGLQDQLVKIKARKQSSSKSTSTVSSSSAEASTSTAGMTSSDNAAISTCSQVSQTDTHPEIPYSIHEPLPPIFGSSLVRKSKSVFMRRSHPNLKTIRWREFTEEDLINDELGIIEMQQYDSEIQHYYNEAKEKSKALREIYDERQIRRLFDENECDCNDYVEEENSISNPIINNALEQWEKVSQLSLPCGTALNDSSPTTPPPTPPCMNCGGENFGPSPRSVCFACILPLPAPPSRSSPSTTPPGTPPQLKATSRK